MLADCSSSMELGTDKERCHAKTKSGANYFCANDAADHCNWFAGCSCSDWGGRLFFSALRSPQPTASSIDSKRDASLGSPFQYTPFLMLAPERVRSAFGGCRLVPRRGFSARVPSAA